MEIDAAERSHAEHGRREDLPVVADDEDVGREDHKLVDRRGIIDPLWRRHRDAGPLRRLAHRIDGGAPARRGFVGAGDQGNDLVSGSKERPEHRHGKRPGAHDHDPQPGTAPRLVCRLHQARPLERAEEESQRAASSRASSAW